MFLNATLFVGEISLDVENITAKVNLEAQVLNLLYFNAGVDASIDRVTLLIQNISAHVILEARSVISFHSVESLRSLQQYSHLKTHSPFQPKHPLIISPDSKT